MSRKIIEQFSLVTLQGEPCTLADYHDQVLLIVNTASRCGFTPQYAELEILYHQYKDRGFTVLGFPCNQFGQQELDTNAEILAFCHDNYHITFPMFEKINVNGEQAHPLFVFLKKNARGILRSESIKWNFTKFLVDLQGNVTRYAPIIRPQKLALEIEKILRV